VNIIYVGLPIIFTLASENEKLEQQNKCAVSSGNKCAVSSGS